MVEKANSETARFLLPFSILSENRKEPFPEEMEKATVFCLAELERTKKGGLILKHPAEKLAFLAQFCYPFWLVPWNGLNLLFDGLGKVTHTLAYNTISDAKTFMENVKRSLKTFEVYMTFLSDNVNYFQTPAIQKRIVINGLVVETDFLQDFASGISEAAQLETLPSGMVILKSAFDESAMSSKIQELDDLNMAFKGEVDILYESMKLLNKTTRNFVKTIRGKIKEVRQDFNEEIKKQESVIAPQISRVNEEYDEQITKLTGDFEKQLVPLQKEKVKLENAKEQTAHKIERYKMEAKACATSKDVVGERKWKEKTNETKKELSETETNIKEVERRIKDAEENRTSEAFRLKSEQETKIKEVRKDLVELEASRDAKIQLHTQEIEKLENLTSSIIEQINKTVKMREANLAELETLGISHKHKEKALIYMPFYMICYQSGTKRRYVVFAPSVANSVGFLARLKSALGKAKVKQLLVPRFKAITAFLNRFPATIEQNAVFEREINEFGGVADMLKKSALRGLVGNGLEQLKAEGWLSEKEYALFAEAISKPNT